VCGSRRWSRLTPTPAALSGDRRDTNANLCFKLNHSNVTSVKCERHISLVRIKRSSDGYDRAMAETPEEADAIGRELTAAIERGKEVLERAEGDRWDAASALAEQMLNDLSPEAKDRAAMVTITRFLLAE
jgi:hypothetical protein